MCNNDLILQLDFINTNKFIFFERKYVEFMDLTKSGCEFLIDISLVTSELYDRGRCYFRWNAIFGIISLLPLPKQQCCAKYLERKIVLINASTGKKLRNK